MKIHREGYVTILFIFLLLVVVLVLLNIIFPKQTIIHPLLYLMALAFFLFIVRFFRDPQRQVNIDDSKIISPADGKIVVVKEVEEPEYFKDTRIQVSIFMSSMDVHKNWYPVSGKIKFVKYHSGKYLVAWHPKSSTLNERTTVVIETPSKKQVLVRQIAGAVARRVINYSEEEQTVKQGDELGFIKFGSRVDIFLPMDTKINIHFNQKVKGCKTVIACLE